MRWSLVALVVAVALAGLAIALFDHERPPIVVSPEFPEADAPIAPVGGPAWFKDVTETSGLRSTYRNGEEAGHFTILESLGGGVAFLDFDRDGLLDLFLPGGGRIDTAAMRVAGLPCRLYRNLGGLRFEDVSGPTGVADWSAGYTHGVAVGDYDRDGWPDLAVTGYGRLSVLKNEPSVGGGRRFREVTAELEIEQPTWATSAAWADLDGDGFPELYVCQYLDWSLANNPECRGLVSGGPRDVCPPQRFKPLRHQLHRNMGGKKFRNEAVERNFATNGCGLGVLVADLNGDARPDIYVANDASPNHLYFNRGGRLEERGYSTGVAIDDTGRYNGSMGVDAADFDGTGRPAIFVTNFQGELSAHYRNLGEERFLHSSRALGLGAFGQQFVGFGCSFLDADHDGWEDMIVANGHVLHHALFGSPYRQTPLLLRNTKKNEGRVWVDEGRSGGEFFRKATVGRGLAVGDLDNDGWPDVVVCPTNDPAIVLRNVFPRPPSPDWVGVRLVGKTERSVVGSLLTWNDGGRTQTRFAKGGGSYLSSSDPRFIFVAARSGTLSVSWSWGKLETWSGLEPGTYWEIREGDPVPRRFQ